jgi:hypothetical protein
MGVWLGPRGASELVIDLASLTAKGDKWNGTQYVDALAPTITPSTGVVSITKHWTGNVETGYGNDKAGIAVSGALDLTDYSKIIVDVSAVSGVGHVAVYVSTSNTDFRRNRDLVNLYDQPAGMLELDVSQLPAGNYYFGIEVCAYGEPATTAVVTISSITATK